MKKAILVFALFVTALTSFSQVTLTEVKTKEDYLRKSKHQKTAAWFMLGGGIVLIVAGFGATIGSLAGNTDKNTTGNVLATVGVVSTLGSIPFFISAAHNKRKAATLSFNLQKVPMSLQTNQWIAAKQPAVTLKISF